MRKLIVLTFAVIVGNIAGCSTPTTSIQNEKIEAEIMATLKDFQGSYNSMDIDNISNHLNNPTTLIGPGGVSISIAQDNFNNAINPIMAYLDANDYKRSEWRNVDVKVLDRGLAIASADVIQYGIGNAVIENFGLTFSMSHDGDNWKISTVATHPPSDQN